MRALSVRQPWVWAVLHAGKRIENRYWNTGYRGPILLHAAKGCADLEMRGAMEWMIRAGVVDRSTWADGEQLDMPRGGIVGRARIVDVVRPGECTIGPCDGRWHMHDQYGFVLTDVEPLPFVPWRGQLGLFDVPDDYAQRGANVWVRSRCPYEETTMADELTEAELRVTEHALGGHRRYRNWFVTGPDCDDWPTLQSLCAKGMMRVSRAPDDTLGGMTVFAVTDLGRARSKRNYARQRRRKKED